MPSTNGHNSSLEPVALYLRVSSEEQRERETIELQSRFFTDYCRLYGLEVVKTYADDGVSGTIPLAERAAGKELLEDARAGMFEVVLVKKLDRLGRSLLVIVDAHDRLQEAGVALRSATEPIDTSNPSGRLIFQMLASFAEYDRANIAERTKDGLRKAYRNGAQVGMIPYGYNIGEDRSFVIVEDEARIVAEIISNVAGGSTLYAEALRLNEAGVPSPGRRYRGREREHGPEWSRSTIRGIIRQGAYSGHHTIHADGGAIAREVPAIVMREIQQRALARLEENKHYRSERVTDRKYLLRSLVRCASCGQSYAGSTSTVGGKRYHYYNAPREGRAAAVHGCPRVSAEWLEEAIWTDVRRFLKNPGEVLERVGAQIEAETAADGLEARRVSLAERLEAKRQEKARYELLFSRQVLEEDDELALEHLLDLKNQIANLRLLLKSAEADLSAQQEHRLTAERTLALLVTLRGRLKEVEENTPEAFLKRRELVRLLVEGVTVGRGEDGGLQVNVTYRFAEPTTEEPEVSDDVEQTLVCSRTQTIIGKPNFSR
jgi:site-specific DNA recombinase